MSSYFHTCHKDRSLIASLSNDADTIQSTTSSPSSDVFSTGASTPKSTPVMSGPSRTSGTLNSASVTILPSSVGTVQSTALLSSSIAFSTGATTTSIPFTTGISHTSVPPASATIIPGSNCNNAVDYCNLNNCEAINDPNGGYGKCTAGFYIGCPCLSTCGKINGLCSQNGCAGVNNTCTGGMYIGCHCS